jgi:anti-sigma-K factor RskA
VRFRRSDPHTLAGAYALDALGETDRTAFVRHLAACEACQQEASSLREAAGQLAEATAVTPPPRLREQVLAEAARTRQQPPPITEGQGAPRTWLGFSRPTAPRLSVAIAGVCILIALGLGALTLSTAQRLRVAETRSHQIAAVLNAPDADIMTVRARTHGSATVVMSHAAHALVLTTKQLPALPTSEVYQVWLMGPRRDRSVGMLPSPHEGITAPMIVSGLAQGDRLGLTVEAAGGAKHPDSPPVLMLGLPTS